MNHDDEVLGFVGIRNRGILHSPGNAGPVAHRAAGIVCDDRCLVKVLDVVQVQPRAGLSDDIGALGRRLRNGQHQLATADARALKQNVWSRRW